MKKDEEKEKIGNNLLVAIKALDMAAYLIYQDKDEEFREQYYNDADKMTNFKKDIKRILNAHF